jgi:quercetin dioxygenase-like cupin family protein
METTGDPSRLRIVSPEGQTRVLEADKLVGAGKVGPLSAPLGTDELKINAVYLEAGSRFRPHGHPFDQILYYEYGTGIVAVDGGDDVVVPTGQYVLLPANVVHMHGCTADGPALQLSLMRDTQTTFDVVCPESWLHWLPDGRG